MTNSGTYIMHELIRRNIRKGNLEQDVRKLLIDFDLQEILEHSLNVANKAAELSDKFNTDRLQAYNAGLLHDVGGIIPKKQIVSVSQSIGIEVLDEERKVPLLLHQKLSGYIARHMFDISDEKIIDAVCCHTTLKSNPSETDMILFIADKLSWDQQGTPLYKDNVERALNISLVDGITEYLGYVNENKKDLLILHPQLDNAMQYFKVY